MPGDAKYPCHVPSNVKYPCPVPSIVVIQNTRHASSDTLSHNAADSVCPLDLYLVWLSVIVHQHT